LVTTILIFIDGLGWGAVDPATNPQHAYGGEVFRLPAVADALPAPVAVAGGGWGRAIDAVLGVPGVPQSATGQTTLLSGVNSQAAIGQHLTGFPNEALRDILREHSVLRSLTRRGVPARFLNAFRPRFWELPVEKQWTLSATTVANLAAGLPFCTLDDVVAGRSIYQDFTNAELIGRGFAVPPLDATAAGGVLGRAARAGGGFTLYEYFLSDKAGHTGDAAVIAAELAKLDAFVAATLAELRGELAGGEALVLLTSDHGNLEDATTRRHTTNPVPLLAWGRAARDLAGSVTRLDQVTPAIIERLALT
jgi:2,3-bisphosphoglycerate-independent phosphoglycerate mutase